MLYLRIPLFVLLSFAGLAQAQNLSCVASANPPLLRLEGIAERTGDVAFSCSGGQPNATITGNLVLFLSVNVTNHVLADGSTDVLLTVNGAPANVPGRVTGVNSVSFNGLSFQLTPQGTAELRLQNLRGNVSQLFGQPGRAVTLYASFSGGSLLTFTSNQFSVGVPQRGLLATAAGRLICAQSGSPLPQTLNFASFVAAGSAYSSTRVTEGFATAFAPKNDFSNQNADTGVRLISTYTGFPSGARLFVPDVIAGTDADQPTSAGDFGLAPSAGAYTPGKGELLLVRVAGADANGAGGTLVSPVPGAVGELSLANGAAYAVYEVVDASPTVRESAILPVFLALPPNGDAAVTDSSVNLAPVSNVTTAGAAPIPRFIRVTPDTDCGTLADCSASYFPQLSTSVDRLQLTSGAATGYIPVRNGGSGVLTWNASTSSSFLRLSPAQGVNNGTIRVDANTASLAPGTYSGSVTIDGGLVAGARTIPVTLVVGSAVVTPQVSAVMSAANSGLTAVVPGSLTTLYGSRFSGKTVSVTFDGTPAQVLFSNDTQINLLIPSALAGKRSAQLVVTVDGVAGTPVAVDVADTSPAIFPGGVLNQNYVANSDQAPAAPGSVLQIFATGLPAAGAITAKVHDRIIAVPACAGPAPGFPGVQQVNVAIPSDLPPMQTWVYVCGGDICSPAAKLWIR